MTDPQTEPATLADVKVGDTVWVFPGSGGYRQSRVKRVTKYQIILDGDDHYGRYTGFIKSNGVRWGRSAQIEVGVAAQELKQQRRAEELRASAAHELGIPRERLNQDTVTAKRAACDRAEAALRELGEWKDA